MELQDAIEAIKQSQEYKFSIKHHKGAFFSYALRILGREEKPWHIGLYLPGKDTIIPFTFQGNDVFQENEEEIMKNTQSIKPLNLLPDSKSFHSIQQVAYGFVKKNYPKEIINTSIFLLQHLDEYGTIWNVTVMGHSLNTINMKISPDTGEMLSHKADSFLSMTRRDS